MAAQAISTYFWESLNPAIGSVGFSANSSSAASQVQASFSKAGTYALRVTVTDAKGQKATSDLSLAVTAAFGTPSFAPVPGSLAALGTIAVSVIPSADDGSVGADARIWYASGDAPADPVPGQPGSLPYLQAIALTKTTTIAARRVRVASDGTTTLGAVSRATYVVIDPSTYRNVSDGLAGDGSSAVSPLCMEIPGPTSGVTISVVHDGQPSSDIQVIGSDLAYTNIPLAVGRSTAISTTIHGGSGADRVISTTATWGTTDLVTQKDTIIYVRRGDSLLLTVHGAGTQQGIDAGQGGGRIYAAVGTLQPTLFSKPGTFTVNATIDDAMVGSLQVIVLDVPFDQNRQVACEVNYQRTYHPKIQPGAQAANVVFASADASVLTVTSSNSSYDSTELNLKPLKSGKPIVLARLGGSSGPIISSKEISEFTIDGSNIDGLILVPNPSPGIGGRGPGLVRIHPYIPDLSCVLATQESGGSIVPESSAFFWQGSVLDSDAQGAPGMLPFIYATAMATTLSYTGTVYQTEPDDDNPGNSVQTQVSSGSVVAAPLHAVKLYAANHANSAENSDVKGGFMIKTFDVVTPADLGVGIAPPNYTYRATIDLNATLTPPSTILENSLSITRTPVAGTPILLAQAAAGTLQFSDLFINALSEPISAGYELDSDLVGGRNRPNVFGAAMHYSCAVLTAAFDPNLGTVMGVNVSGTSSWYKAKPKERWHNVDHFDGTANDKNSNNHYPTIEIPLGPNGMATFPVTALPDSDGGGSGYAQVAFRQDYMYGPDGIVPTGWETGYQLMNKPYLWSVSPAFLTFAGGGGMVHVRVTGATMYLSGQDDPQLAIIQEKATNTPDFTQQFFGPISPGGPNRTTIMSSGSTKLSIKAYGANAFSALVRRSTPHLKVTYSLSTPGLQVGAEAMTNGQLQQTVTYPATPIPKGDDGIYQDYPTTDGGISFSLDSTKNEEATADVQFSSLPRRILRFLALDKHPGAVDGVSAVTEAFPTHAWVQVASGNLYFTTQVTGYATPIPGPDVTVSYNSLDNIDCGLGAGWRTNYDVRVYGTKNASTASYVMSFLDERGAVTTFIPGVGNGMGSGVFIPNGLSWMPGAEIVMAKSDQATGRERCSNGEIAKLIRGDGRLYFFGNDGWLVRTRDLRGEELHVQRDPSTGFATEVHDDHQRSQALTRAALGDAATGSQPLAALKPCLSGSWAFLYDARGNLSSIALKGTFSNASSLTYGIHYDQTTDRATSIDYPTVNGSTFTKTITQVTGSGNQWDVTEPLGGKTTFTLADDRMTSWKDPMGISHQVTFPQDVYYARVAAKTWIGRGYWNPSAATDDLNGVRFPATYTYNLQGQPSTIAKYGSNGIEQLTTMAYAPMTSAFGQDGAFPLLAERRIHGVTGLDGGAARDLVTTFAYETSGKKSGLVSRITDATGNVTAYAYTDTGLLSTLTDPNGQVWKFENFDSYGNAQTITSPEGVVTSKTYAPDGTVLTITDAQTGDKTTLAYDTQQRVRSRTFNSLPAETTTYDPLGNVLVTTDVLNRTITHEYDAWSRPTKLTDSTSSIAPLITTYAKDADNSELWVVTATQGPERLSQTKFDKNGRTVAEIVQRYLVNGSSSISDCTITHEYDQSYGWETKSTDAGGFITQYEHDYQGRTITVTGPTTAAANPVAKATYNGLGWPLTRVDPDGNVTTTRYAADGQVAAIINPAGGMVRYAYDPAGHLVAAVPTYGRGDSYEYDRDGIQTAHVDTIGRRQTSVIDRSTRTIVRGLDGLATQKSVLHLDQRGYVDVVTNAYGATSLEHADDGTMTSMTAPGRSKVTYGLDKLSRVTQISQPVPLTSDPNHVSMAKFTLDSQTGRLVSTLDPVKHLVAAQHNDQTGEDYGVADNAHSGSLTSTAPVQTLLDQDRNGYRHIYTDALGRRITETHDPLGRPLTRTLPSGASKSWHYTPGGLLDTLVDGPVTTTYGFNALGQVTSVTIPGRATQKSVYDCLGTLLSRDDGLTVTTWTYDPQTRLLLTVSDSNGKVTSYHRDTRGRATDVLDNKGHGPHYNFDDLDRPTGITHADGKTEGFLYFTNGDLQAHRDRSQRTVTSTWDSSARMTSRTYQATGRTVNFGLEMPSVGGSVTSATMGSDATVRTTDVRGRLTTLALGTAAPVSFSYNAADQITSKGASSYDYDSNGRTWHVTVPGQGTATFGYDAFDRLQTLGLPNQVTRTYAYDGAGAINGLTQNIGTLTENWGIGRDSQGRMATVTGPGSLALSYDYDGSGRLVLESRAGDLPLLMQYAYDASDNRTDAVTFAGPLQHIDAFATAIGSEVVPVAGTGTWSIVSGALSATGTGAATSATLALASGSLVGGPTVSVSVTPALPGTVAGATSAGGIAATASDGSVYRALWQLAPPPAGQFSPPAASGRMLIQHVPSGGGAPVVLMASDWMADAGDAKTLSMTVWPDQRATARIIIGSTELRGDVDTPGIASTMTLALSLVVVAEGGAHGAATFDNLTWTTASSRTARHSTFDPFNVLTAEDITSTDSAQNGRHRAFAYSAAGTLLTRTLTVGTGTPSTEANFGYDELDRMTAASVSGTSTAYAYYADSWMRASAVSGTTTTTWTYDGAQLLSQTVKDGTNPAFTTSYLHQAGKALWESDANGVRVYAYDPMGNVRGHVAQLTSGSTTGMYYQRQFDYDAFGSFRREQLGTLDGTSHAFGLTPITGTPSTGLRAKGMWLDAGLNLYKTQTRSYAPDLGRFTQLDPAHAGQNWYAYAGGDPINRSDPSGLDWQWEANNFVEENPDGNWKYVPGTNPYVPMPTFKPKEMGGIRYVGADAYRAIRDGFYDAQFDIAANSSSAYGLLLSWNRQFRQFANQSGPFQVDATLSGLESQTSTAAGIGPQSPDAAQAVEAYYASQRASRQMNSSLRNMAFDIYMDSLPDGFVVPEAIGSRVSGLGRVAGGGAGMAASAGLTSTGAGTVAAVPLAMWSGDQIGTGVREIWTGKYGQSLGAGLVHYALGDGIAGDVGSFIYDVGPNAISTLRGGLVRAGLHGMKKEINYNYRYLFSGAKTLEEDAVFYTFKNSKYFKEGTTFAPKQLWLTPNIMTPEVAVQRLALPYAKGYDMLLRVTLQAGTRIVTPRRVWSLFGRPGGGVETLVYGEVTPEMYEAIYLQARSLGNAVGQ